MASKSSIKIFTRFNRPRAVGYPSKGEIENEYQKVVEDGHEFVKCTGQFNLQDFIDAPKEETLVYTAINRFIKGDPNALDKVQGFYADVTAMPKTLMDAQNMAFNARIRFDSLPLEIRQQFDNNVNAFVKGLNDGSVEKSLRTYISSKVPSKEVNNG